MTARQFISDALMEIGILGADETIDAGDADLGLRHLQGMVDLLQADRLLLYTVLRATYPLVPNTASYTIGPTGTGAVWLGARPLWVSSVGVTPVGGTTEYPVLPYHTREAYLTEPYKGQTGAYPTRYLYEPATVATGTFIVWPVPTTAAQIAIATPVPLDAPLTLNTDLFFPPGGYLEGWRLNLAKRLERPFLVPENQGLRLDAMQALARIRRLTDEVAPWSRSDPAVVGDGSYDIRGGTYR